MSRKQQNRMILPNIEVVDRCGVMEYFSELYGDAYLVRACKNKNKGEKKEGEKEEVD